MNPFRRQSNTNLQSFYIIFSRRTFTTSKRYPKYDFTDLNSGGCSGKFDITDLTCPHTWYPNAQRKKRNVFLHVGPTNSGKTYHALKQLQSSSSGVYCGPLRLLAWEVAKKLNKAHVPCDLITGQEKDEIEGAMHKSVIVEMADVTSDYQCAVIDEIQGKIEDGGRYLCSVFYGSLPPET